MLRQRWLLYAATCAVVFGLEALFVLFAHVKLSDFYAGLVGTPLIVIVVTVFAGSDARNKLTAAQRWERIVERAWAIILFDVGLTFVQISGIQTMLSGSSDAGDIIMGFLTLLLSAMLVYAEPYIALEDDVHWFAVIAFAIVRSMTLGWVNISRIFSLFAVQISAIIGGLLVQQAATQIGASAALWIDLAYGTVVAVPLAVLYTVAYLDTLSQERNSAV